ncbi:TetR family transcriptional regulator [Streptomyces solincola]|uniref:TetR family transcriptional regulator n=1 Tax=Streptomyces solincola TaxID=2100817 RepID=A0A2S9PRZ5_9ACTN|nr:TetR/AcrR family transcriptional regulator [Streptomyces solincola]PRH77171.1 TetR family transcriptional regulator [Streptomyces solincola]
MSPRGVAIPDLRGRLFDAAERVLTEGGPAALTSRAVTTEAGCAKGVLHTHFEGLDAFVAELVLDRFARTARQARELSGRAGDGTVAGNLTALADGLLGSLHPAVIAVAATRSGAAERFRAAQEAGAPGLATIERDVTGYLDAERKRGRLPDGTDTEAVALAFTGTLHHILMASWSGPAARADRVRRLVAVLVGDR